MANPQDPGKFEHWITDRRTFKTVPPKSGDTGDFEKWLGNREYWEDYVKAPAGDYVPLGRTGEGLSFVAAEVEVKQLEGDLWLSLSCFATSIAVAGGDRGAGEVNVFCDERPVAKPGKKGSQDVTVRYIYTEVPEEAEVGWAGLKTPFETIREWDDAPGGEIWLRYWPAGKTIGNYVLETGQSIITSFLDPQGEAGTGGPVLCEFAVKTEELTKSAWAGS